MSVAITMVPNAESLISNTEKSICSQDRILTTNDIPNTNDISNTNDIINTNDTIHISIDTQKTTILQTDEKIHTEFEYKTQELYYRSRDSKDADHLTCEQVENPELEKHKCKTEPINIPQSVSRVVSIARNQNKKNLIIRNPTFDNSHNHNSYNYNSHNHNSYNHNSHNHNSYNHNSYNHNLYNHNSHNHNSHNHNSHNHNSYNHNLYNHNSHNHNANITYQQFHSYRQYSQYVDLYTVTGETRHENSLNEHSYDSLSSDNSKFRNQYHYRKYNPIDNCKSAGVIPYCYKGDNIYFLFQKSDFPLRNKDDGWNDFGGKKTSNEMTFETAAREFSEETNCLFYLKDQQPFDEVTYDSLKNNSNLSYSVETVEKIKQLIPISKKYYFDKISQYAYPLYTSSKEIYISYFVKVDYIPAEDLPCAEDIHIPYEVRYKRTCQWFSLSQILLMNEQQFHKRLQITKIQSRIDDFNVRGLFY